MAKEIGFRDYSNYGGIWVFYAFQTGTYNIRVRYKKTRPVKEVKLGFESFKKYDGFWVGEVLTPWKKLYLR